MGALGLLFVLHTQALTGSYARGGLVAGAYTLALGLSNPRARPGRRPPRARRSCCASARRSRPARSPPSALLPAGAPTGVVICAALAGAAQPPVGACMRALWPVLLRDADRATPPTRPRASLLEVVYICGPLAIVAGIGSWSLTAALGACAASSSPATSRSPRTRPRAAGGRDRAAARDLAGALRGGGVRVLLAVFALLRAGDRRRRGRACPRCSTRWATAS